MDRLAAILLRAEELRKLGITSIDDLKTKVVGRRNGVMGSEWYRFEDAVESFFHLHEIEMGVTADDAVECKNEIFTQPPAIVMDGRALRKEILAEAEKGEDVMDDYAYVRVSMAVDADVYVATIRNKFEVKAIDGSWQSTMPIGGGYDRECILTPDGMHAFIHVQSTKGENDIIQVIETRSSKEVATIKMPANCSTYWMNGVFFSRDGRFCFVIMDDRFSGHCTGFVVRMDLTLGNIQAFPSIFEFRWDFVHVTFNDSATHVILLKANTDAIYSISVSVFGDGDKKTWGDCEKSSASMYKEAAPKKIEFMGDDKVVILRRGQICIQRFKDNKTRRGDEIGSFYVTKVYNFAISHDRKMIVTLCKDATPSVWSVEDPKMITCVSVIPLLVPSPSTKVFFSSDDYTLYFILGNKQLVAVTRDNHRAGQVRWAHIKSASKSKGQGNRSNGSVARSASGEDVPCSSSPSNNNNNNADKKRKIEEINEDD